MAVNVPGSGLDRSPNPKAAIGISAEDLSSVRHALSGLSYPVERWQLLDHVTHKNISARLTQRTIDQLWTLPNRRYHHLDEVITALARTLRGHPRRPTNQLLRRPSSTRL